jgi:hypothetical protein
MPDGSPKTPFVIQKRMDASMPGERYTLHFFPDTIQPFVKWGFRPSYFTAKFPDKIPHRCPL